MLCPTYLSYGMTWEEYWFGDPWMARAFHDAFVLKRRMRNEDLWLQGLYNYTAFQAIINTAFGKKRDKYVDKPFDVFPKTKAEKEQEKIRERNKLIRFLNAMLAKSKKSKGVEQDGKP